MAAHAIWRVTKDLGAAFRFASPEAARAAHAAILARPCNEGATAAAAERAELVTGSDIAGYVLALYMPNGPTWYLMVRP